MTLEFPFVCNYMILNIKLKMLPVSILQCFRFSCKTLLAISLCWYTTRCDEWTHLPFHSLNFGFCPWSFPSFCRIYLWHSTQIWQIYIFVMQRELSNYVILNTIRFQMLKIRVSQNEITEKCHSNVWLKDV